MRNTVDGLFAGESERPLVIVRSVAAAIWLILLLWLVGLTPGGAAGFPPVDGLQRSEEETPAVRSWLDEIAAGSSTADAPQLDDASESERQAIAKAVCGSKLDGEGRRARAAWLRKQPELCPFDERRKVLAPFSLALGVGFGWVVTAVFALAAAITLYRATVTFQRTRDAYRLLYASGHLADRASADA